MVLLRSLVCTALLGLSAGGSADAAVILDGSSVARYNSSIGTSLDTLGTLDPFPCANIACGDATVSFPTAPNLSGAAGVLGDWLTNPASPGGAWTSVQAIPSTWAINTETAIVYEIGAGGGLANVGLSLGVDNGIFVWLDGTYLFGTRRAGGSSPGEYVLALPNLTAGTHYLQIMREDHGGATGYAIELTADVKKVPEPGTLALLGFTLTGLAFTRRRRQ